MLIVLMSMSMIFVNPTRVSADTVSFSYGEMVDIINSVLVEQYGKANGDEYYIGSAIYLHQVDGNNSIYRDSGRVIYPIYDENMELFLTFYVNEDSAKISTMFNEIIDDVLDERHGGIIVIKGDTLKVCTENYNEITYSGNSSYVSANYICANRYQNHVTREIISNVQVYRNQLNLPNKAQNPYSNGCWAACMASIIQHYTGVTTSTSSVISTVGCGNVTRTESQVANYLLLYYDIYAYTQTPSPSTLRTNISGFKACILGWTVEIVDSTFQDSSFGHMTICDGYSISGSNYTYNIMDPNDSNGTNYARYTLSSKFSTSFPENEKIYVSASGYKIRRTSVNAQLAYNRYEPNREEN